jgi:hypothetical protein
MGKTEASIRAISNFLGQKVTRVYFAHNGWTVSVVNEPIGYRLGCWKGDGETMEFGYGTMADIDALVRLVWEQPR